ncbi:MAG: hypothetical protein PHU03_07445 [Syntrophales bacterium]|nr:hypothetical protein [Syntrophales bacterium]
MGEIKSTLDPVMERTRDMTLSDEEKTRQKQRKIRRRHMYAHLAGNNIFVKIRVVFSMGN